MYPSTKNKSPRPGDFSLRTQKKITEASEIFATSTQSHKTTHRWQVKPQSTTHLRVERIHSFHMADQTSSYLISPIPSERELTLKISIAITANIDKNSFWLTTWTYASPLPTKGQSARQQVEEIVAGHAGCASVFERILSVWGKVYEIRMTLSKDEINLYDYDQGHRQELAFVAKDADNTTFDLFFERREPISFGM